MAKHFWTVFNFQKVTVERMRIAKEQIDISRPDLNELEKCAVLFYYMERSRQSGYGVFRVSNKTLPGMIRKRVDHISKRVKPETISKYSNHCRAWVSMKNLRLSIKQLDDDPSNDFFHELLPSLDAYLHDLMEESPELNLEK